MENTFEQDRQTDRPNRTGPDWTGSGRRPSQTWWVSYGGYYKLRFRQREQDKTMTRPTVQHNGDTTKINPTLSQTQDQDQDNHNSNPNTNPTTLTLTLTTLTLTLTQDQDKTRQDKTRPKPRTITRQRERERKEKAKIKPKH